ncbi:MAG: hypothetical protein H0V46_01575 [Sphingomonas sp.]|nr:hypothetical protein [Sphingomonas sp.]
MADSHDYIGTRFFHPPNAKGKVVAVQPLLRTVRGNIGAKKLFMVCRQCNTGWMNVIQRQAKSVLTPMIGGEWSALNDGTGRIIATWAAMTASVIAMTFPDTNGVSAADRSFIKERQATPPGWHVWIGRGSGFEEITYGNRVAAIVHESQRSVVRPQGNTAITTIALRQLLIHTVNVPDGEVAIDPILYGREIGVFPIHPWGGATLDWRWIPIIANGSQEWNALRDNLLYSLNRFG